MHARRRDLKKPLHVCFSRSATVQDAVLMDVGQELALSFGVGRVHKGLLLVDIDTIHGSCLRRGRLILAPDAGEGGLDLLLEAGDQFAVGGDQRLLGFDLGDDGLLGGKGREGKPQTFQYFDRSDVLNSCSISEVRQAFLKIRTGR